MTMATDDSLVALSAVELKRLIEARQISPVELPEACIARIVADTCLQLAAASAGLCRV